MMKRSWDLGFGIWDFSVIIFYKKQIGLWDEKSAFRGAFFTLTLTLTLTKSGRYVCFPERAFCHSEGVYD